MPNVNLFEWEDGSYAVSGVITPAIPEQAVITVSVTSLDERVSFTNANGDIITGGGDSDSANITVIVPAGSTSFTIPVVLTDDSEPIGDAQISLEIVSFVIGQGGFPTIIEDEQLTVTVVDDDIEPVVSLGPNTTNTATADEPGVFEVVLDRAFSEDVGLDITVTDNYPPGQSDQNYTFTITDINFVGTVNAEANGEDPDTVKSIELIPNILAAPGIVTITANISTGNATGGNIAQSYQVTGVGSTLIVNHESPQIVTAEEWNQGLLGAKVVFNNPLPGPGRVSFSISQTDPRLFADDQLQTPLPLTFNGNFQAGATQGFIPIYIKDTDIEETPTTIQITITDFVSVNQTFNGQVGSTDVRSLSLISDDRQPLISIASDQAYNGSNQQVDGDTVTIVVSTSNFYKEDVEVTISPVSTTSTGQTTTAVLNRDYSPINTVTIPAYSTSPVSTSFNILDTAYPNVNLYLEAVVSTGNATTDPDEIIHISIDGDANQVTFSFAEVGTTATEYGNETVDIEVVSDTLLPETVDIVIVPENTAAGRLDASYTGQILQGTSSVIIPVTVGNEDITNQDVTVSFSIDSVNELPGTPLTITPVLDPTTFDLEILDDEQLIFLSFGSNTTSDPAAGDTATIEFTASRISSQDIQVNLFYNNFVGTLGGDITAPASVVLPAGSLSVTTTYDVAVTATTGSFDINAGVDVADAAYGRMLAGQSLYTVAVDGAVPAVESTFDLSNYGPTNLITTNEWDGETFQLSGTITPAVPVGGYVTIESVAGNTDQRVSLSSGGFVSSIDISLTAGQSNFTYNVYVSDDTIANAGSVVRYAIVDASSTDNNAVIAGPTPSDPTQHNHIFKLIDDDVATNLTWSINPTSVLVPYDQDVTVDLTFDLGLGVSADTTVPIIASVAAGAAGSVVFPNTVVIPAHSTTVTSSVTIEAGTQGDVSIRIVNSGPTAFSTAYPGTGNDLVTIDPAHTGAKTVSVDYTTVGSTQGPPSILKWTSVNDNYYVTDKVTSPLSGYIQTNPSYYLVQTTVPIDPVDEANLPSFMIDGTVADVFPVSYVGDLVDTVQVVGPADPTYTVDYANYSLTATSSDNESVLERIAQGSPSQNFITDVNLDSAYLTIHLDNGDGSVNSVIGVNTPPLSTWTEVEVVRDGSYIKERQLFTQFDVWPAGQEPVGYSPKLLGVTAYVTQRADLDVAQVEFIIHNDIYDPTIGDRYADHPEVNGDVFFYDIKLNLPAGLIMHEGTEFVNGVNNIIQKIPSETFTDDAYGYLVRPIETSNPGNYNPSVLAPSDYSLHLLPRRSCFAVKVAISQGSETQKAHALWVNRFGGYAASLPLYRDPGTGKPFGNNYFSIRGWGGTRDYIPDWDRVETSRPSSVSNSNLQSIYSSFDSSGFDALKARSVAIARHYKINARSTNGRQNPFGFGSDGLSFISSNLTNSSDPKVHTFYRPYGEQDEGAPGGFAIRAEDGIELNDAEIERSWAIAKMQMMRNRLTMTSPTGKPVSIHDIAKATQIFEGTSEPILPFAIGNNNGENTHWPHFNGPFVNDVNKFVPLCPTNRMWSTKPSSRQSIYNTVRAQNTTQNQWICEGEFSQKPGAKWHTNKDSWTIRSIFHLDGLVWNANLGSGKWLTKQYGNYYQTAFSNYDTLGTYTLNGVNYQQKNSYWYNATNAYGAAQNGTWTLYGVTDNPAQQYFSQQGSRISGWGIKSVGLLGRLLKGSDKVDYAAWADVFSEACWKTLSPGRNTPYNDGSLGQNTGLTSQYPVAELGKAAYLDCTLSSFKQLIDLPKADFITEYQRRKGINGADFGGYQDYMRAFWNNGVFSVAQALNDTDPNNLTVLETRLRDLVAYPTLRQWEYVDKAREYTVPALSAYDYDDPDLFVNTSAHGLENTLPAGQVINSIKVNGQRIPSVDHIGWDFVGVTGGSTSPLWNARNFTSLKTSYRLTGDERFLKWGKQGVATAFRGCEFNDVVSMTLQSGSISNYLTGAGADCNDYVSVVPSSYDNATKAFGFIMVNEVPNGSTNAVGTLGYYQANLGGLVGEMAHVDWNLSWNPDLPDAYNDFVTAYGQDVGLPATGCVFDPPDTSKRSTDLKADWIFSGMNASNEITDLVSSLILKKDFGSTTEVTTPAATFTKINNESRFTLSAGADLLIDQLSGGSYTIEIWARCSDTTLGGPARLVSWSDPSNPTQVGGGLTNFMFGMNPGGEFNWRGGNYSYSNSNTSLNIVEDELQHFVISVESSTASGVRIWINTYNDNGGTENNLYIQNLDNPFQRTNFQDTRVLSNTFGDYALTIANEKDTTDTVNRYWLGDIFRVSVYAAALDAADVSANFYAGPMADNGIVTTAPVPKANFNGSQEITIEDATYKEITVTGRYNLPLQSATTLTVSANIPAEETRLSLVGITLDGANSFDISLDAAEQDWEFTVGITSATGNQGDLSSTFKLVADSSVDSDLGSNTEFTFVVNDGATGGTGGGTGGGTVGGTGGGTGGDTGGQGPGGGQMVNSITTDEGVTWYFDGDYEAGRYVTGDWWVVGPVNVIDIYPKPEYRPELGGYINGSMINPETYAGYDRYGQGRIDATVGTPDEFSTDWSVVSGWDFFYDVTNSARRGHGWLEGWETTLYMDGTYDHNLNAAWPSAPYSNTGGGANPVSQTNPITLQPGDTLHSSWCESQKPWIPNIGTDEKYEVFRDDGTGPVSLGMYSLSANPQTYSINAPYLSSNKSQSGGRLKTIQPLTCLDQAPAGFNGGGRQFGDYYANLLPGRIGSWYAPTQKYLNDTTLPNRLVDIAQENKDLGIDMLVRSKFPTNFDQPYTQSEIQSLLDKGLRFVGQYGLVNQYGEAFKPGGGNLGDDWPMNFTVVDPDGDGTPESVDFWMLGHEAELNGDWYGHYEEYDSTKTYSIGDKVYVIDRLSNGGVAGAAPYGKTTVFEASATISAGQAPVYVLDSGDDYEPADGNGWTISIYQTYYTYGLGYDDIKQRAEQFKQQYPDKKLYYYFSKGVSIAGWFGLDPRTRAGYVWDDGTVQEDQLSFFSAVAQIPEFDGFLFDYYPHGRKPTGAVTSDSVDPPELYDNPYFSTPKVVDDPKWVVSGVHRIKEWSTTPEFPSGKPVYPTLEGSPIFVSSVNDQSVNPYYGLLEYYHNETPSYDQVNSLVLSCLEAGADGFIWFMHAHKWRATNAGTGVVQAGAAGPFSDGSWPWAWREKYWSTSPNSQGQSFPILDENGNHVNVHQLYFPNKPGVDVSGDGTYEMIKAVNETITNWFATHRNPVQNPVTNPWENPDGGWFRPGPFSNSKTSPYHTSAIDYGKLKNLPILSYAPNFASFVERKPTHQDGSDGNPEVWYQINPSHNYPGADSTGKLYAPVHQKNSNMWCNNIVANDNFDWRMQQFGPVRQTTLYGTTGGGLFNTVGHLAVLLNLDVPLDTKKPILYWLLQVGIDLDERFKEGAYWVPEGGHKQGRYFPIWFKRIMFNEDLTDLVENAGRFSENLNTFYVPDYINWFVCEQDGTCPPESPNCRTDPTTSGVCNTYMVNTTIYLEDGESTPANSSDPGLVCGTDLNLNYANGTLCKLDVQVPGVNYSTTQIGMPEWNIYGFPAWQQESSSGFTNEHSVPKYKSQLARFGYGMALAIREMGLVDQFGHKPFLDYIDRAALLNYDPPYMTDANGDPIGYEKREPNTGNFWTGSDDEGWGRQAPAYYFDKYRYRYPDFSLSAPGDFATGDGWDCEASAYRYAEGFFPTIPYANLSDVLPGTFPSPPSPPSTDPNNNSWTQGAGDVGDGNLYPPAIDDSADPTAQITGKNTGHRLYTSAMDISAITTDPYYFVDPGDCGALPNCTEVPVTGLTISGVVFSGTNYDVANAASNGILQIKTNNPLNFVDCLFIGQLYWYEKFADGVVFSGLDSQLSQNNNGDNVGGSSTEHGGNSYIINGYNGVHPQEVSFEWCTFRGCRSKTINVPLYNARRLNIDWYVGDSINIIPVGTYPNTRDWKLSECWIGPAGSVRAGASCNPGDRPELFDCVPATRTFNGFVHAVERCIPTRHVQCGATNDQWFAAYPSKAPHSDTFQQDRKQLTDIILERCTFAGAGSPEWSDSGTANIPGSKLLIDRRGFINPASFLNDDGPTIDGYLAPSGSDTVRAKGTGTDQFLITTGGSNIWHNIYLSGCYIRGAGSYNFITKSNKFIKTSRTSGGVTRYFWQLRACAEENSPTETWESISLPLYNATNCSNDTGYSSSATSGVLGFNPTIHWVAGNQIDSATNYGMYNLNDGQNINIPHQVIHAYDPSAVDSNAPYYSCDYYRSLGYTEAAGYADMSACITDNYAVIDVVSDYTNKWSNDNGLSCRKIRLTDGTTIGGTTNPVLDVEDFLQKGGAVIPGSPWSILKRYSNYPNNQRIDGTLVDEDGVTKPYLLVENPTSELRCECDTQ